MSHHTRQPMLKVEGLKMYFPVRSGLLGRSKAVVKAVDNISLEIYEGETFGLVGESGCGKTTAGKCVLRILDPTEGSILFQGDEIAKKSPRELEPIRRDIQLIFQDPYGSLDPRQSSFSMLKEALVTGKTTYTAQQIRDRVDELLVTVGLSPEMAARYPHELSGGQRQRLGIARALACDPKLIVCDEPVSALDVSIQAQIINLFKELQAKLGLTYLFVAHDLAVVRHIANRIGVMYLGEIVEIMESEELYRNPLHPYTQALLSAVPTTDYYEEQTRSRMILKGEVPSPMNKPSGCAFHPRCNRATDVCQTLQPTLLDAGSGHMVSCHHAASHNIG